MSELEALRNKLLERAKQLEEKDTAPKTRKKRTMSEEALKKPVKHLNKTKKRL